MRTHKRGSHKIFIGMAPGVGKTYRMLDEGHRLRQEGIDVVIGLVETHKREETAAKAVGLEIIPRRQVVHSGIVLTEIAHTNVPGSPLEKRYQDVEKILAAGIDVYSTVNIQHLESLTDLVTRITGVIIRERIPDRLLEESDEVVVVDVTPETLEERLRDGKIYAVEEIDRWLQNFFQRRNLIALRELALREVADNIEENGLEESTNHSKSDTNYCNIHERVLVCVSTYPNAVQLIRRGARIAGYMHAPLYCLFVDNPDRFLTKEESLHLETCEALCKEFGGEFLRVSHHDKASAIASVAQSYRVTQIVIGESQRSRWKLILNGSLTHRLLRSLKEIDVHIIATEKP
jgi:two-component system, OmpR family, sensor histidine kinase KdpD